MSNLDCDGLKPIDLLTKRRYLDHSYPVAEDFNLAGFVHGTGETIHALAVSPDGRFFAAGDENGVLQVYRTWPSWTKVHGWDAGRQNSIRIIRWHPVYSRTLIFAAANGYIYRLKFSEDNPKEDDLQHFALGAYIYGVALDEGARKMVIASAHGLHICEQPFRGDFNIALQNSRHIPVRKEPRNGGDADYAMIPIDVHWVDVALLCLTFIDRIEFYSLDVPHDMAFEIRAPNDRWIGRSFVTPGSGEIVASNMIQGFDIYSTKNRALRRSIQFDFGLGEGDMCGIESLTPNLLAIGQRSNGILFASLSGNVYHLRIDRRMQGQLVLDSRTVACGLLKGTPFCLFTNGQGPATVIIVVEFVHHAHPSTDGEGEGGSVGAMPIALGWKLASFMVLCAIGLLATAILWDLGETVKDLTVVVRGLSEQVNAMLGRNGNMEGSEGQCLARDGVFRQVDL